MLIKSRGPESTKYIVGHFPESSWNYFIGFHRLGIMDPSNNGDQPMSIPELPGVILICNGEIYNYKDLCNKYNFKMYSGCDCEIILHLYKYYKNLLASQSNMFENLLHELDGYYAFILIDSYNKKIYSVRDPHGVRPLYYDYDPIENKLCFASEGRCLTNLFKNPLQTDPEYYYEINIFNDLHLTISKNRFYNLENICIKDYSLDYICQNIRDLFIDSIKKRCVADRPIGCLLSGGIDSTLVTVLVNKFKTTNSPLKTFSIGLQNSPDLFWAKKVADFIKSDHHEIIVTEKEFIDVIPEIIKITTSYDTTTVRASVGNYLISKWISINSPDIKVVFNGDYSDEIWASYKYFKYCQNPTEFNVENIRLLKDIYLFDSLRSDRCISNCGLEPRTPFADHKFLEFVMSIKPELKMSYNKIEKYLLRLAFDSYNIIDDKPLPKDILYRSKTAFSDGVSDEQRSWFSIIQDHVDTLISNDEFIQNQNNYSACKPILKESYWYRKIHDSFYPDINWIPYFWLPKQEWVGINHDPSARTLK